MNDGPTTSRNPFVGLRPYDSDEALLFFGRSDQTVELLERLHRHRFLAIVGSSGCGKSSLVRAGLIPKLKAGLLVGERDLWTIVTMKPGDRPLRSLATSFLRALPGHGNGLDADSLSRAMYRSDVNAIIETFGSALNRSDSNVLLLADQFEEIFRFSTQEACSPLEGERESFVSLILNLAQQESLPVYVAMTMRSDFIGECDTFFGLPEAINRSIYLVPRLTRRQRREVIEGPIRLGGGAINQKLVSRLLNDAGDESDQLPVLQHALLRVWDLWQSNGNGPIDTHHYEAIGGFDNALSQDAEKALEGMSDDDLIVTEQLFQLLTTTDSGNRQIRKPASLNRIEEVTEADSGALIRIIERFCTQGRNFLVVSDEDASSDPMVDISHESLIRQWDRLKVWVSREAEAGSMFRRLAEAATRYKAEKAGLWRNPELQLAREWKDRVHPNEPWAQRYGGSFDEAMTFLDLSEEEHKQELRARRRRMTVIAGAVVLVALIVAILLTMQCEQEARHQLKEDLLHERLKATEQREVLLRREADRNRVLTHADSIRIAGELALSSGNFQVALLSFIEAHQLYDSLGEQYKRTTALLDIGMTHALNDQHDEAREIYDSALELSRTLGDNNLEGKVLEMIGSLNERAGQIEEAEQYYAEAQQRFQSSGEQQANGRVLERLAVQDEAENNYGAATEKYKKALTSYNAAGDQLGVARMQTAIQRIQDMHAPWGYLVDLHTSELYKLEGEEVKIGRTTTDSSIINDVSFENTLISRRHLNIAKRRTGFMVDDLRSRNGTSINGLLLRYGVGAELNDKDIVTLANMKALLFLESRPESRVIPPLDSWAILIDSTSRSYTYLTHPEYSLKIEDGSVVPYQGQHDDAVMRVRLGDPMPEMVEVEDQWTVIYTIKQNDYDYGSYYLPEGQWYELLSRPLWYLVLSSDSSAIVADGPSFQIISFKEITADDES